MLKSKVGTQNGTLANGNMDLNLRSAVRLILTHTRLLSSLVSRICQAEAQELRRWLRLLQQSRLPREPPRARTAASDEPLAPGAIGAFAMDNHRQQDFDQVRISGERNH